MAASGVNANWTACTHGTTAIDEVKSCSINAGGQLTAFSSGVDRFPTKQILLMSMPTIQITTDDVGTAMALVPGTTHDLTITLKDAMGATGGDIIFVGSNATVEAPSMSGTHAQLASGQTTFKLFSSDGSTNPLSFTRA
jgi:hypothetical protein